MLRSGEYYYVQLKYLKDCLHLFGDDRNGRIVLERLSGTKLNELSDKYGITSEAVRQAACRTVKNRKVSAGVISASNKLLIEEYGIKNGHELFCILKNTQDSRKKKMPKVQSVRNPSVLFGKAAE